MKVMFYRNRGNIRADKVWRFGNHSLDIVDKFNYLGTVFNYTGSFNANLETIVGKALRVLNVLVRNIILNRLYNCNFLIHCRGIA